MRQILLVKGDTPEEFVEFYNNATEEAELSGFKIESEKFISDTKCFLFVDTDESSADIENIRKRAESNFKASEPDYIVDATDGDGETDTIDIRLTVTVPKGRFCAECENLNWGRGCPFADGHVDHKNHACSMFNIILNRG